MDYAGHPAELDSFLKLGEKHGLTIIEDACHALGAEYRARRVGCIAHMTVFSFHPVKHLTTGEGGMVTTNNAQFAEKLRSFRNHGINGDARDVQKSGGWFYEMTFLGFNYRLTDIACALGIQQLSKLDANLARRREIADRYTAAFREIPGVIGRVFEPKQIPRGIFTPFGWICPSFQPIALIFFARCVGKILGSMFITSRCISILTIVNASVFRTGNIQ